jgi:ubiquinone/menaquinone biosynthesis C-methylase UbiE
VIGSAAAYSATGGQWERGPARIYDRLAEVLVSRSPVPLGGRRVLDVGAGTGAASRAALAAGAAGVVAVDAAHGMLAHEAPARPPAVVGDLLAMPFGAATFGASVAAFSLNHVEDPVAGLREMARVTRRGGTVLAATYAGDDDHPVKHAVAAALAGSGWVPEPWYRSMAATVVPLLASPERFATAATEAGLSADVQPVRVRFPDLGATELVAWRLGMVQHAPFVARLSEEQRRAVASDALDRLGPAPAPLVRSILVLTAVME